MSIKYKHAPKECFYCASGNCRGRMTLYHSKHSGRRLWYCERATGIRGVYLGTINDPNGKAS